MTDPDPLLDPDQPPDAILLAVTLAPDGVASTRRQVRATAVEAGLRAHRLEELLLAVHEIVTNAVRYAGGGELEIRRTESTLVCRITDAGPGIPPHRVTEITLSDPATLGGRGLWLAHAFADDMTVISGPDGTTVDLRFKLVD